MSPSQLIVTVVIAGGMAGAAPTRNPEVPCPSECHDTLKVCLSDGSPVPVEPDTKLVENCSSLCRMAPPRRFYGCLDRPAYCGGLFPCIRGE